MTFVAVNLNDEIWLICGGRDFSDQALFDQVMSDIIGMYGMPRKVVHGDALGADQMAAAWANRHAIEVCAVPADWQAHGRAAGPIRNEEMLTKQRPRRVIAFPGGRGTADMVERARKRKGEVDLIQYEGNPGSFRVYPRAVND